MIVSNVYSDITGRFDMIISNPPFHDGLQTSLTAAETLIRGAVKHLPIGGQLRIVANAFLPYPDILDATFGSHEVLAQNGRFKVYQATVGRPPRAPKNNSPLAENDRARPAGRALTVDVGHRLRAVAIAGRRTQREHRFNRRQLSRAQRYLRRRDVLFR